MIQDRFVTEVAQAIAGEAYSIPEYTNISNTIVSGDIDATDTTLIGEIGTRLAVTTSRISDSISYSAIRSATTDLVSTSGDLIKGFGTFVSVSGGTDLMTQVALDTPFTQTSSFDVELITTIDIARSS